MTTFYKHKIRGTTYEIVAIAKMQSGKWKTYYRYRDMGEWEGNWETVDGKEVVIYRCCEDGVYWVRPKDEFFDGRFEEIVYDFPPADPIRQLNSGRDLWETANQLGGYPGPGTRPNLATFLYREAKAAEELANEVLRLRIELAKEKERADKAYQLAYEKRLTRYRSGCSCNIDPDTDELISMCMLHVDKIQEAKNEAYEEAAKVADLHKTASVDNALMPVEAFHLGADSIAAMIRYLKKDVE